MNKLPEDFEYHKYGIDVRLVTKEDSEFVCMLRSNKELTRYIHSFNGTLRDQQLWLNGYKEREKRGEDYYFIYSSNGYNFGVNRVYNIKEDEGTTGSWICVPGSNPIQVLSTAIILYDICFDVLCLRRVFYDTRKENNSALKVNRLLGGDLLYETDMDYHFALLPEKYFSVRERLLKNWHIM